MACAGEHDNQRVSATIPTRNRNNPTTKNRRRTRWVQDPLRHRASNPNPSRPSRSSHMGQRRQRIQSWPFLPRRGSCVKASNGLHAFRIRCAQMHRTKSRRFTHKNGNSDDTTAFQLQIGPTLQACSYCTHASSSSIRCSHPLQTPPKSSLILDNNLFFDL